MKFLPLLLCAFIVFAMAACKKKGCTDSNALNYDAEANEDDGTCRYPKAVFYSGGLHTSYWQTEGCTWLHEVYLDDQPVGTLSGDTFAATPACGSAGALTVDLHGSYHDWYSKFTLTCGSDTSIYYQGGDFFSFGECEPIELY